MHTTQQRLLSAVFAPLGDAGRAQRVEDRIMQGITAGVLADGDRLPSEAELASSLGVAMVTAREALVRLRERGLVTTRRGRDGGTFVTLEAGDQSDLARRRLTQMSRVELRDLALHYAAIAATAAELAAEAADPEETAALTDLLAEGLETHDRRTVGDFMLELAALSQSARLTREYVRLHTDFGALLSLAHADSEFDHRALGLCNRMTESLRTQDGDKARQLVNDYVHSAVAWLLAEHSRLHRANRASDITDSVRSMQKGKNS
ncbi:GntR family transcriptional regulator [Kocuria turfanensis]|uniref:GntR family transcriptional regulator n=1 Tax=Kocuria turfanensis TaxID=388357 RepID=A0A512IIJ6_9MICC|nr:winged helix-turn-helix domain-containing protein [Kocuria turfanensis]GEO97549.1 GntR family transcriptional regulator [Kocuria turfanensis]